MALLWVIHKTLTNGRDNYWRKDDQLTARNCHAPAGGFTDIRNEHLSADGVGMALSFEFVNGFHDTANAVATVIYTNRCRPGSR